MHRYLLLLPVIMTTAKSIPFTTPPLAPPDPIFAVTTAFDNCNIEGKVSLGVGAYRDAFGDPRECGTCSSYLFTLLLFDFYHSTNLFLQLYCPAWSRLSVVSARKQNCGGTSTSQLVVYNPSSKTPSLFSLDNRF